ncbi:retrovirus-related pol polyprotein from transposon TNT 1-94 [Tanacetum coccineum]
MLAPNLSSYYNDRASFVNPMYLKKAQSEKPCLYKVPYDKDDHANIFSPNCDKTLILEDESRSKLDKDLNIIDIDWQSRLEHKMDKPITHEITVLIKDLLMPLAEKTRANASEFEYFLKEEMFEDLQDIAISELKKLIEKSKGKSVETKFDKPPVVRQTNAIKVPKPSVLGKQTPFSNSLKKRNFSKPRLVTKTDVRKGLSKPVTPQNLPQTQTGKKAKINKNLKFVKDQLCSSCELGKAKRSSFKSLTVTRSKKLLDLLHMDLCGPMRIESINGKKYILVIVDDFSRYTWTLILRSKDETPEVLKEFLKMIQRKLQAQVITVQTDRGT